MFRNSIVLIDDDQKELDDLNKAFLLAGLPCFPVKYEIDPDNDTGIDHLNIDTSHVRVIAIDLNLNELPNIEATAFYPSIESVLRKINPQCPYLLLFWTKNSDIAGEVIELLKERSSSEILAPIQYGNLDKAEFLDQPDKLSNSIKNEIDQVKVFKSLLLWEERVAKAVSQSVSELYDLSLEDEITWDFDKTSENFSQIISHIAHESVGKKNVVSNTNFAIESGLLPVIEDRLLRIQWGQEEDLNTAWETCLPNLGRNLKLLSEKASTGLNSFYSIEELSSEHPSDSRGVFVKIPNDFLEDTAKCAGLFGSEYCISDVIKNEFLINNKPALSEVRDAAIEELSIGWLEIGAACDHAQSKNRLQRYILGALIPFDYEELCKCEISGGAYRYSAHDGIYRHQVISYNGNPHILILSYRYTIGAHGDSEFFGDTLFRVKDKLLNSISFNWSNFTIRPGTTHFR